MVACATGSYCVVGHGCTMKTTVSDVLVLIRPLASIKQSRFVGAPIGPFLTRNLTSSLPTHSPAARIPDASWAFPKVPLSSLICCCACLVAVPVGFIANYSHADPAVIFCANFVAIFPSATILSTALHDLNFRLGQRLGALINQTLGNTAQLILSILLLKSDQVTVLKLSILGSILSNLLLTTGLSFLVGGRNRIAQHFDPNLARMISKMLLFSMLALTTPSTLRLSIETTTHTTKIGAQSMSALSRGISILILLLYLSWLIFSWRMGNDQCLKPPVGAPSRRGPGANDPYRKRITNARFDAEEALGSYTFSTLGCFVALVLTSISIAFNTQFTTDSLQSLLLRRKVSQTFLSLIILPLLSIDPMAISMANQNDMDMSILLTLERCMQTSLLLAPLVVLAAWRMESTSMDLEFDKFSLAVLFLSVILVTHVLQSGKSNWMIGVLLIQAFAIIALAAFVMPEYDGPS